MKRIIRYLFAPEKNICLKDVCGIGDSAFANEPMVEGIVLAKDIRYIGKQAFENAMQLKVYTTRDINSLYGESVSAAIFKDEQEGIDSRDSIQIQYRAFKNCKNLLCLDLDITGIKRVEIEKEAFSGCHSLRTVVITDVDTVTIADDAFDGCPNVVFVSRSKDVERYARENNFKYIKL